jgi:protein phosphatase
MRAPALEELEYAALLHDIGRTAIQRDILMKRGRLTEQEMQLLQAHPRIGAEIIGEQRLFPRSAEIVHAHHEQPDGKGYPRGLAGEAVPMGSRIIMAVAAFDAMTSDRPYRRGLSPDAALEELLAHSGTQFDPAVVEALVRLYASGALFDEFDAAHLDHYRDGHEHSRAVESHLKVHGGHAGVPDKAGLPGAAEGRSPLPFPVIELPAEEPVARTSETTVTLKAKGPWRLVVAGHSDVGCSRSNNEDSFGVYEFEDASRGCLLVLADGMGGAAAGEVASSLAIETVAETFGRWNKRGPVKDALSHAIGSANRAVHERAAGDSQLGGMGTTCTALAIIGLELTLGHVGDSRAYLVRRGVIEQLTQDHTLAAELERLAGTRSAAVAAASSHVLTRCIGAQPEVEVDLSPRPIPLEDGALLVLCSDGLSNVVEPSEIQEIVSEEPPAEACASLVELARGRGGPDNITVIVGSLERG